MVKSNKPQDEQKVPAKFDRQAQFRADVVRRGLSPEAAVDEARLIPKSMVLEFKVKCWPR